MIDLSALPADQQELVAQGMEQIPPDKLFALMTDAQRAADLRASGDEAGCQAILSQYKELAESVGLGEIFAALFETE